MISDQVFLRKRLILLGADGNIWNEEQEPKLDWLEKGNCFVLSP